MTKAVQKPAARRRSADGLKAAKPRDPANERTGRAVKPAVTPRTPRHRTPRNPRGITPPSLHTETTLPVFDVGSRRFEEMCRELVPVAFEDVVSVSMKRKAGQRQFGVDVEGFDAARRTVVILSAKCYHDVRPSWITDWMRDFLDHVDGHWKGRGIRDFVLAVTHEFDDDDMNDAARAVADRLREVGITFHLWNLQDICRLIERRPVMVGRYFGSHWSEAFLGRTPPGDPAAAPPLAFPNGGSAARQLLALQEMVREFGNTSVRTELSGEMKARLDAAIVAIGEGRSEPMQRWLRDARADEDLWLALDPGARAKALRSAAMANLGEGRTDEASALLDEADALDPARDRSARTYLLRAIKGTRAALDALPEPLTPKEREIKAGLLIEADVANNALALLRDVIGADVTPETLRLRAIAKMATGQRHPATSEIAAACRRAPRDATCRLTQGVIRLLSALAEGARMQFGNRPNPIDPGMVRTSDEAMAWLEHAAGDFEALRHTDGALRTAAECWRLAALLVHPRRSREAALLARSILSHDVPDPVAVAWCARFGLVRRPGRIKKVYGDMLRDGEGTATHLIVLAQLTAGTRRNEAALRTLERHAGSFPRDVDLLAVWRAQYGGRVDPEAGPFTAAAQTLVREQDEKELTRVLATDVVPPEEILAGAMLLGYCSRWTAVDALRTRLVGIGTPAAIELAARGALAAGKPSDCVAIISAIPEGSIGRGLPDGLRRLRIRANEVLGRHNPVIADLLSLGRDGPEAVADRRRLVRTYLRIGAMERAGREAREVLERSAMDADEALGIAHALRTHDPETARQALSVAVRGGVNARIAGTVLTLAADLGMDVLQQDAMRLIADPDGGTGSAPISSVDEVVAMIESSTSDYRKAFAGWLDGAHPAAVAMHHDQVGFARLFLAEPAHRRNALGERFPMLLRSGMRAHRPLEAGEGRLVLRMDPGAVLLATRLGVLGELERAFSLQIPSALPECLVELEAVMVTRPQDEIDRMRDALRPAGRTGALAIRTTVNPDLPTLGTGDDPWHLDAGVVAAILDRAFQEGHAESREIAQVKAAMGITTTVAARPLDEVAASPESFLTLFRSGAFELVVRAVTIVMREDDAARCLELLDTLESNGRVRNSLRLARESVASALAEGRWTTVASDLAADVEPARPLSAQLRCLTELLQIQDRSPELLWVEDRALSHANAERWADVIEVMEFLARTDVIDVHRLDDIRAALHSMGYEFLAPSAGLIATALSEALVDPIGVIETPTLARVRRWIASGLLECRHLNSSTWMDAEGVVHGEVRHFLRLHELLRETLLTVWSDPGLDDEGRIARSEWAWTCLRAGSPPLRDIAVSAADQARHDAVTIAHLTCAPLFSLLGGSRLDAKTRRAFVRWLWDAHGSRAARACAGALDDVAEVLSLHVARLVEDDRGPEAADEEHAKARELAVGIARDFVDALPDDLRGRVAERRGISDVLGLRDVLILHLGDGLELPVADLASAAHGAVASPGTPTPVTGAEGVTFTFEDDGGRLRGATIRTGSVTFRLPAHVTALLLPSATLREAAGRYVQDVCDPRAMIDPADWANALRTDALDERHAAVRHLMDESLFLRLRLLRDRFTERTSLRFDDLHLPSPTSVASYLGMTDPPDGDVVKRVRDAATGIVARLGVAEASARLAASPITLPIEVLDTLTVALARGDAGLEDALGRTMAGRHLRLRASARLDLLSEATSAAARAFVGCVEAEGKVFLALVRLGAQQALDDASWRALDPAALVALIWTWADRVGATLLDVGVDPDGVARWILGGLRNDLPAWEAQAQLPEWARRLTVALSLDDLAATMIASIHDGDVDLGRIDDEVATVLRQACGREVGGNFAVAVPTIAPPSAGPEDFWAAKDPVATWVSIGWLDQTHPFATRDIDAIVERLLADGGDWWIQPAFLLLLTAVGLRRVDDRLLPRIWEALDHLDAHSTFEPDGVGAARLLSGLAVISGRQGHHDAMASVLASRARLCAAEWPSRRLRQTLGDSPADRAFVALAGAAQQHATTIGDTAPARMAAYGRCLEVIGDAWPGSRAAVTALLDDLAGGASAEAAVTIWPTLLAMRVR